LAANALDNVFLPLDRLGRLGRHGGGESVAQGVRGDAPGLRVDPRLVVLEIAELAPGFGQVTGLELLLYLLAPNFNEGVV
jgi:hypothetical protein